MKELSQLKTEELKVMVYDHSVELTRLQNNLKVLNQEIESRSRVPDATPNTEAE